jgi:hypothetical protein
MRVIEPCAFGFITASVTTFADARIRQAQQEVR